MLNDDKLKKILPPEKIKALKIFIQEHIVNNNVVGIMLTGSHVHGDAGKHADLDIFILLNVSDSRTRGNVFINDIEIEYFINPIIQIEKYYEQEYNKQTNHTAHMFANCIVLYETNDELKRLIELGKEFLGKELPEPSDYGLYNIRYQLDDHRKDLLDAFETRDKMTFELVSGAILKDIIVYFGQIKKFYPAKAKRLIKQLELIDYDFSRKLQLFLTSENTLKKRCELLIDCISYIESMIGGPRPDSFSFTSPLSL